MHPRKVFPTLFMSSLTVACPEGVRSVLFREAWLLKPVHPCIYLACNSGGLEIADDLRLYMTVLGVPCFLAGGVPVRPLSAMTRTEVLRWLPRPHFSGQSFCTSGVSAEKKPQSPPYPRESITDVTYSNHVTQLMCHLPYRPVTLAPELVLYLLCRYGHA